MNRVSKAANEAKRKDGLSKYELKQWDKIIAKREAERKRQKEKTINTLTSSKNLE